jgi:hypothetical protein
LVATGIVALACIAGEANSAASRFCLLTVERPADEAALKHFSPRANRIFAIPGLGGLVLEPPLGSTKWFIGADRRLVPYTAVFPRNYLDKWVVESWSSRVVATPWGGGLAAMKPGGVIETIVDKKVVMNWSAYALPRSKTTVAVSGKDGAAFVVQDDNSLTPWLPDEVLKQVGGIVSIHDSPLLDATIVLARRRPHGSGHTGGDFYIVKPDRTLEQIGSLGESDGTLHDVPAADAVIFVTKWDVHAIRKTGDTFAARKLFAASRPPARSEIHFARQFGQVLSFRARNDSSNDLVWQRLGPNGFEAIPGAKPDIPHPRISPHGQTHDLPMLGYTLIDGADAFYAYDGTSIRRIDGSDRSLMGEVPRIFALTAIGRVLVSTSNGLFELTRDATLVPRPLPVVRGSKWPMLVDWAKAGVALLATKAGMVALDDALNEIPITGGESAMSDRLGFLGFIETTGEPVVADLHRMFIAADRNVAGRDACPPAPM